MPGAADVILPPQASQKAKDILAMLRETQQLPFAVCCGCRKAPIVNSDFTTE